MPQQSRVSAFSFSVVVTVVSCLRDPKVSRGRIPSQYKTDLNWSPGTWSQELLCIDSCCSGLWYGRHNGNRCSRVFLHYDLRQATLTSFTSSVCCRGSCSRLARTFTVLPQFVEFVDSCFGLSPSTPPATHWHGMFSVYGYGPGHTSR